MLAVIWVVVVVSKITDITTKIIIMKQFEIFLELPKYDTGKWENAAQKIVPIDLLHARLKQTFPLLKKKKNSISVKHNKVKCNFYII